MCPVLTAAVLNDRREKVRICLTTYGACPGVDLKAKFLVIGQITKMTNLVIRKKIW